jgi:penicillin-binding protein 2
MLNRDGDRQRMFSRRAAILAGGKFALLSTLIGRMYYLLVVESDRFQMLADENRINLRLPRIRRISSKPSIAWAS